MPRTISTCLCLCAVLFVLAPAASADAPPKKKPPPPRGRPPLPARWQPPALTGGSGTLVNGVTPLSLYTWPAGQVVRGETMNVSSSLILANRPAPAGHLLELHVETTPNKFVRAAWTKTNAAGAATLQWKVGAGFPLGNHRWFVRFPGTRAHKANQTALYPFQVFKEAGSRVLYFGFAPMSLYGPVNQMTRRDTMQVTALLSLPNAGGAGHVLELHVERTPGTYEKVTSAKTDGFGLATLKWKPGPLFPAGDHRWYVRFPGNRQHTANNAVPLTFQLP